MTNEVLYYSSTYVSTKECTSWRTCLPGACSSIHQHAPIQYKIDVANSYDCTFQQFNYVRYNKTDLPMHVYATSAAAFWALCGGHGHGQGQGCHQTILLAGESGSGKSFTASLVLEHLVEVTGMLRSDFSGTAQDSWGVSGVSSTDEDSRRGEAGRLRKLIECRRMIMESFGNSQTVSEEE